MKPTQEALKMQLNLAKFQRNPGGDYNEYFMPSSIRMVLATMPEEELDANVRRQKGNNPDRQLRSPSDS